MFKVIFTGAVETGGIPNVRYCHEKIISDEQANKIMLNSGFNFTKTCYGSYYAKSQIDCAEYQTVEMYPIDK